MCNGETTTLHVYCNIRITKGVLARSGIGFFCSPFPIVFNWKNSTAENINNSTRTRVRRPLRLVAIFLIFFFGQSQHTNAGINCCRVHHLCPGVVYLLYRNDLRLLLRVIISANKSSSKSIRPRPTRTMTTTTAAAAVLRMAARSAGLHRAPGERSCTLALKGLIFKDRSR